jgi:multidrug efflux pump subunit AcrA (membrane-fusion protein)
MNDAKLLSIPLMMWFAGCGERHVAASREPLPAVTVSVVTATSEQWPSVYQASGTVRARSAAIISAKWMGYVSEVKVQAGDRVHERQLLVTLDTRDLDANVSRAVAGREEVRSGILEAESAVAVAKTNLDLAQVTLKRMSELYEKRSISNQEFDEASAKLRAAEAVYEISRAKRNQLDSKLSQAEQEVRAAQVARSYAEIRAPFAGVVTAKSVDPGNLAVPGVPLLTIERDSYRLEAAVEESRLGTVHLAQEVSVMLDGIDRRFDSRVSEIVPAVDAASRTYTVKIDLPATPALRSGLFGRAVFRVGTRPVLAIPAAAVTERGQLQSVFVADGGIARTRLITIGEKANGRVEVLSGLNAGEKVIYPIPQGLSDGTPVEVKHES